MGTWCYRAQGSGPTFFGTGTVSLPTVGNCHPKGQKVIYSWLSLGQRCSSSFTELNAANKDREQSCNVEVTFYKSSFRGELYYTCQFSICWKASEQVVLPKFCLKAVRQILLFVFPSLLFFFFLLKKYFFPLQKSLCFLYNFKRKRMAKTRMHSEKNLTGTHFLLYWETPS